MKSNEKKKVWVPTYTPYKVGHTRTSSLQELLNILRPEDICELGKKGYLSFNRKVIGKAEKIWIFAKKSEPQYNIKNEIIGSKILDENEIEIQFKEATECIGYTAFDEDNNIVDRLPVDEMPDQFEESKPQRSLLEDSYFDRLIYGSRIQS